jgi:hypothetical protein
MLLRSDRRGILSHSPFLLFIFYLKTAKGESSCLVNFAMKIFDFWSQSHSCITQKCCNLRAEKTQNMSVNSGQRTVNKKE